MGLLLAACWSDFRASGGSQVSGSGWRGLVGRLWWFWVRRMLLRRGETHFFMQRCT